LNRADDAAPADDKPTEEPRPMDESYKRFFSHRTMVLQLLKGFVPGKWQRKVDFSTLEPMPTNFVSDLSRQRYCDVVWRVQWKKTREWVYLYVLIEFQSRSDHFMATRLMVYEGLLFQAMSKLPEYRDGSKLLPAVIPIVVYTGAQRWKAPLQLSRLMEPLPEEMGFLQAELAYIVLDAGAFAPEELAAMHNLVAVLFRLENSDSPRDAAEGLLALREELETEGDAELTRSFEIWLEQIVKRRFPNLDIGRILDNQGETMLAQKMDEWFDEAEKKGEESGQQKMVLALIKGRFGPPTQEIRRRLSAITSAEELTRLAARVFQISSLDQLWAE
jgi:predicted transposase/invertase (TIGR01784 family)